MKFIVPRFACMAVATVMWGGPFLIHSQESGADGLPVVSVTATSWKTAEPCPVCLVAPGILRFERSEPGKEALTLRIATDGTATPGKDFVALPSHVEIPAGESFVEIYLAGIDDELVEGPEVVRVKILPLPSHDYVLRPGGSEALVVIGDIEFGATDIPQARLDIIHPKDGQTVRADSVLRLDAIVVWTESEVLRPVEFYADDRLIGMSQGVPVLRPPIPCFPSVQTVYWTNPPAGDHEITARVPLTNEEILKSPPVNIRVEDGHDPKPTVVSIEATWPIAEESSHPYRRIPFRGLLTISRTGPTDHSLPVYLHYSGTATLEDLHPAPPLLVSIPAGEDSTQVEIVAQPDELEEGIETLEVALANCPPDTRPPLGAPCYAFEIDPARASATVFLRDDGITRADLDLTSPQDGDVFSARAPIQLEAVAIDLEGYISRVEFFADDRSIGVSEIVFVRPPDPGTPIYHQLEWIGAETGGHVLTARAAVGEEGKVVSDPVRIKVGEDVNLAPRVALVQPESGTIVPAMTPIDMVAVAEDMDGFVRGVRFLVDGRQIGEVKWHTDLRPAPGDPQRFRFVWWDPAPGLHTLTAHAVDNDGAIGRSDRVEIRVEKPLDLPVVNVVARDPVAVELSSSAELNTATFVVRRWGGVEHELAVRYSLHGTAVHGVDYDRLPGAVHFKPGQEVAEVEVRPVPDKALEGIETVVLRLEESDLGNTDPAGSTYRIGRRGRAVAIIRDEPWKPEGDRRGLCLPLAGGYVHVCFEVEPGRHYRLDGSIDMHTWETLHRAVAVDGAVYFVDEEGDVHPRRFYRVTEEVDTLAN